MVSGGLKALDDKMPTAYEEANLMVLDGEVQLHYGKWCWI